MSFSNIILAFSTLTLFNQYKIRMNKLLPLLFLCISQIANAQLTAIGEWNYHLSFTSAYNVAQNENKIFVASQSSVFTIDKSDRATAKYSKLNALSDVGVSSLAYGDEDDYLFIGYVTGNIDLVQDGYTYNLNDIKRSNNIIGSKEILHATFFNNDVYVSTGFGIVIINLKKLEIKETIYLGDNGSETPVYSTLIKNDTLYAASESGLYFIEIDNPFISNYEFWKRVDDFPNGQQNGPISQLTEYNNKIFVTYRNDADGFNDITYKRTADSWDVINDNQSVLRLKGSPYGLLMVSQNAVELKTENGSNIHANYTYQDVYYKPYDAVISEDSTIWIPNLYFGIIIDEWDYLSHVLLNGPHKDLAWKMSLFYNNLWIAGGAVSSSFGKTFSANGAYHYLNGVWNNFNKTSSALIKEKQFNDVISVTNDVNDPGHAFIGSYGDGLIEIRGDSTIAIFDHTNMEDHSLNLGDYGSDTTFIGVSGLSFDLDGNLWVVNPLNTKPVSVLTSDGEWKNFSFGSELSGNLKLSDIVPSFYSDQKWIIRPRNGILVFDDGGTPLDESDDLAKAISDSPGKGNLPSLFVGAIAEDLDGEIWVGTEKGPAVFYSPGSIFSGNNFDCRQILIEQDGNVQILLETESISAIAVDGGNRKWIGTSNNGVYLLSPDGTETIHHFTSENSPLLNNSIYSLVIDHLTGEIFIGTNLGIVSFRSDAIAPSAEVKKLHVYPNPVRQDYFGPIAINGMASNSEVRISDSNGNAVNQIISEGGQAIWDGTDFNGQRVNTGVYFIFASDQNGDNKGNGKVLIIK